jgi:hypothetical protein
MNLQTPLRELAILAFGIFTNQDIMEKQQQRLGVVSCSRKIRSIICRKKKRKYWLWL